jgi:hypothetical protein
MDKERKLVVEGPPGTKFQVYSRGQDPEANAAKYFDGEIDKSGRMRVAIPIRVVVVTGFPGGGGSIRVEFGEDEYEKTVTLPS